MDLFKRIGREKPGNLPELEVAEFPTADTPDGILFQEPGKPEMGSSCLNSRG